MIFTQFFPYSGSMISARLPSELLQGRAGRGRAENQGFLGLFSACAPCLLSTVLGRRWLKGLQESSSHACSSPRLSWAGKSINERRWKRELGYKDLKRSQGRASLVASITRGPKWDNTAARTAFSPRGLKAWWESWETAVGRARSRWSVQKSWGPWGTNACSRASVWRRS